MYISTPFNKPNSQHAYTNIMKAFAVLKVIVQCMGIDSLTHVVLQSSCTLRTSVVGPCFCTQRAWGVWLCALLPSRISIPCVLFTMWWYYQYRFLYKCPRASPTIENRSAHLHITGQRMQPSAGSSRPTICQAFELNNRKLHPGIDWPSIVKTPYKCVEAILSAESQKGVNTIQRCSVVKEKIKLYNVLETLLWR